MLPLSSTFAAYLPAGTSQGQYLLGKPQSHCNHSMISSGNFWVNLAWSGLLFLSTFGCGLPRSADKSNGQQQAQRTAAPASEYASQTPRQGLSPVTQDSIGTGALEVSSMGYELDKPDLALTLPPALAEISDITTISEHEIACVQDELGIVYVYDIRSQKIVDEIRFGSKGDYEGLTKSDSKLFVLRSDGKLFELSSLKHHPTVQTYDLHLPATESEGLCLDAKHNRLLIAPKTRPSANDERDWRPIYAFDLQRMAPAQSPVFSINVRAIRHFAKYHSLPIPRRVKKGGEGMHNALHFLPSAIAIHPITGEVFLLSAQDHILVSCTETGSITGYALLDAGLFRQPEGLAFFPNGDMLISNEAGGKVATLLLYRWRRPSK
jgi:hypothetical protein